MKKYLFIAATAIVALASCSDESFVGNNGPNDLNGQDGSQAIVFNSGTNAITRAGEFVGATAAEKLGGMFVVEGTKGSEETNSPSTTVVFDNYLVGYTFNSAGTTESNTNNWEYVGLEKGITGRMTGLPVSGNTWSALHPAGTAQVQTVKYWDYSQVQYDFIAWSTGTCEAVPVPSTAAEPASGKIQVSRIATGSDLSTSGFTMRASSATDLLQCYYTDITTVTKESGNYGKPVTLTFRNMAAKIRVALYETVPGYSVKEVEFYQAEASDPTAPDDLDDNISDNPATLFTTGSDELPQSGTVTVLYPRIGKTYRDAASRPVDYNKASVTVAPGDATDTKQEFGPLTAQYRDETGNEPDGKYLGMTLPTATFAGDATKNFYTAVVPNTNGMPLTLRVNYTLVSTDGSAEEIHVYGAKAVVPATYTKWLPNYAYTYIFKISDNSNGYTSMDPDDPQGLFPITFDAMVTSFVDANAEQTTVTTVATPSITTYQQGHTKATNEYSKNQTAGVSSAKKALYVQVMDNSGATPTLKADLNGAGKSLLFKIEKAESDYVASEAEVMDALQNHAATYAYNAASPVGRNSIQLKSQSSYINNAATSIVNGVDDQPITGITAGKLAEIDIKNLATGTYAYVYCTDVPSEDEVVFNVVSSTTAASAPDSYYEVDPSTLALTSDATATENKVYFVANKNAKNEIVSYTFVQTKVGVSSVTGLYEAEINLNTHASTYTAGHFYFDVYNQNNGKYAVKVIKVVE